MTGVVCMHPPPLGVPAVPLHLPAGLSMFRRPSPYGGWRAVLLLPDGRVWAEIEWWVPPWQVAGLQK
jgi:hypothetical protein